MVEGYDLQSAGVVAPALAAALHLPKAALGFIFSIATFGMLIGAAGGGMLSDRIGRKPVLVLSLMVYGAFSIGTAWASGFGSLMIVRFLTGFGLGSAFPSLVALMAKHAGRAKRVGRVTMVSAGMPLGGGVAVATGLMLSERDWPHVFILGGVAPLLLAMIIAAVMPREPVSAGADGPPMRIGWSSVGDVLFGDRRTLATLALWAASICTLLVLYLMVNWLPTLMLTRGLGRTEALTASLGFNLAGTAGALAFGLLLGPAHRAKALAMVYAAAAIGTALLASSSGIMPTLLAVAIVGATITAAQFAIYGLSSDYYSVSHQGTGAGAAIAVGRAGAIAGPLIAGAIFAMGGSPTDVILILLPLMAIALAALIVLVLCAAPATKS